ncbi:unnamed protein product, partial [marine sediment metagenome]
LKKYGIEPNIADNLHLLGISSIGNLVAAIKFAKYYEFTEKDHIVTVFTDSMELYGSRLKELSQERGAYNDNNVERDMELLEGISIDNMLELTYYEKKRIHNLKYYTWIEQQQKDLGELNAQWYDHENYWGNIFKMAPKIDELINSFNEEIGSSTFIT